MIMYGTIPFAFRELYSERGRLKLIPPPRYKCNCEIGFAKFNKDLLVCEVCGEQLEPSALYNVFKRMVSGQIKEEDFILKYVKDNPKTSKASILRALSEQFPNSLKTSQPLKFLTYYAYLKTEPVHLNGESILLYTINKEKNLIKRLEANVT